MSLGKLLKSVARAVKNNPDKVLIAATILAPGLVGKLAPKVVKVAAKVKAVREVVG